MHPTTQQFEEFHFTHVFRRQLVSHDVSDSKQLMSRAEDVPAYVAVSLYVCLHMCLFRPEYPTV